MPNQRIFIFGGPDRCGKTTIAKTLSKVLDIPYFKPTNQQYYAMNDPKMFMMQTRYGEPKLLDFIKQTGQSVVMDRGFPCDYVYSKVLGRETDWLAIQDLDREYAKLGAIFVATLRYDYSGIEDQWSKITTARLRALHKTYEEYAGFTHMKSLLCVSPPINPGPKDKPYPLKQQVADILALI